MTLTDEQKSSADYFGQQLGQGLPFKLNVHVAEPHDQCLYHRVIYARCSLGLPRNIDALLVLQLALVTEEGRERGYESGVAKIYTHHEFAGLNIASILVRNMMPLFQQNGDTIIECNTETFGAHFWQNLGWQASEHGTEFGETVMDEGRYFMGWRSLVGHIKSKVYDDMCIFKEYEPEVLKALALLDKDDPSSIQGFVDSGIKVEVYDDRARDERRTVDLAFTALAGLEVNTVINTTSNVQMARLSSKLDGLIFDQDAYRKRFCALSIDHSRRIWQEDRFDALFA